MHGASEQCMHATEIDFSAPTTPSLIVTTRRRFTPQGTSCSFLQAVTQPLHSIQRSESQMNFILAIAVSRSSAPADVSGSLHLADGRLRLLHHRDAVVPVGRRGIHSLAPHNG